MLKNESYFGTNVNNVLLANFHMIIFDCVAGASDRFSSDTYGHY